MIRLFLFVGIILLFSGTNQGLAAQNIDKYKRRLAKFRNENWPPERSYSRISLGYALQRVFSQHAEFCGFKTGKNSKRDYVPADIDKFLGRRNLRTKVEVADISGGGLLFYIFGDAEMQRSFDEINYSPIRIADLEGVANQFAINPDQNFDAFILTKTCGGYLKAFLDAGIEPPYLAFKAAFDTDSKRESSVFALSGSFVSPLKLVLEANDFRTVEFMMKLWNFYQSNPEFDGHAYYLREFEGVMIKHISSAQENTQIERSGGVNLNGPLAAHLKADFGLTRTSESVFSGTDWETIIYSDYEYNYERQQLFSPLPNPDEINRFIASIKPVFQKSGDFPLMTEGFEHTHFLVVEGIPENMTTNFWEIESVAPGVYREEPRLDANYYFNDDDGTWGCKFTVTGRPDPSNFIGPLSNRPSKLDLSYVIRSREPVGGDHLRFYINEEIQTSSHPIASIADGEFDLSKKENRRFALQWKFEMEIEDHYNPVDFGIEPYIGNLTVRNSNKVLDVRISDIEMDRQRRRMLLTLETLDSYPLERIDDGNMITFNMAFDLHLQSARAGNISVRPVKSTILFPTIKPFRIVPIETPILLKPVERDNNDQ